MIRNTIKENVMLFLNSGKINSRYFVLFIIFLFSLGVLFFFNKSYFSSVKNFIKINYFVKNDIGSVSQTFGMALSLKQDEISNIRCDTSKLLREDNKDTNWQVVCESKARSHPYLALSWKKSDFLKSDFQNEVLNEFMGNRSKSTHVEESGDFSCDKNSVIRDMTKMRTIRIDCVTKLKTSSTTLYTNFIYSYPIESVSVGINPVIIISGDSEKEVYGVTGYILNNLVKSKKDVKKNHLSSLLLDGLFEKAYASGGGSGGGDGGGSSSGSSGDGSGSSSGSCSGSDSGSSGTGCSGDGTSSDSSDSDSSAPDSTYGGDSWYSYLPVSGCGAGTLNDMCPPVAPANLSVSCNPSTSEATISWSLVDGATGYYPRYHSSKSEECSNGWTKWEIDEETCYKNDIKETSATYRIIFNKVHSSWVHAGNNFGVDWEKAIAIAFMCPAPKVNINFNKDVDPNSYTGILLDPSMVNTQQKYEESKSSGARFKSKKADRVEPQERKDN